MPRTVRVALVALMLVALLPTHAHAYIGPGAGFALAGSFMAVFAAVCSAIAMLLTWPIRLLWRLLFGRRALLRSRFKRVVVLGLDGLDHGLTERLLGEGKLPHLAALRDQGCFKALASTLPPISPVAWSTFQTGVNPGKHNIFDFLTPDLRTYQPKMSSVEIRGPSRFLRIGPYKLPLGKGHISLLRKSQPFWSILSKHGITSCIQRVPITFPPEKLRGVQLSAMCVPDLRGTQGMFSFYTTERKNGDKRTGGDTQTVALYGDTVRTRLVGPENPLRTERSHMETPLIVTITGPGEAILKISGAKHRLRVGQYSDWVNVSFRAAPGVKVHGVCRFLLLSTKPEFRLYVTPINIDPEKPVMPVGYPAVYSVYLAKRQGPFATLGLAEDTWALNDHVLDDAQFLQQCIDIDRERESMFFDGLEKIRRGLCVCVFDGTDRMQHMYWRYLDQQHPARAAGMQHQLGNVIENLYRRMDDLVGKTIAKCQGTDTLLLVISDHGFNTFRRGIDLNRWLEENGYLVVDDARRNDEHLVGVDWTKTRAFAVGLTGIFINQKDKYSQGIVDPADAEALRTEIAAQLATLVDPASDQRAIKRVYQAVRAYRGPYKENAPDLIIGYDRGYRVSWETAIGRTTRQIFHDNTKAWSGDHCVDPSVVPGVLFCNHQVEADNPRLIDLGPTILDLFGVPVPDYMDGQPLTLNGQSHTTPSEAHIAAVIQPA